MTMMRLAKTVVEPTAKNGFIFTILGTNGDSSGCGS